MESNGRKVDNHMENPLDSLLVDICEPVSRVLKKLNFTPNMITTIGLIIGLISIYFIIKRKYAIGVVLFIICYFFDCLDGYYARKYDMVTRFGDYYDHFRDLFICITILIILYIRYKELKLETFFVLCIIILILCLCTHMGCQEHNSAFPEHNECLGVFKNLCPHKNAIHYTRFVGCGTFIFTLSFFIIFLAIEQSQKKI